MLSELLRNVPITRSPGEVRELLAKDMPVSIVLSPDEILVLNAKRDAYYTVTPEACSCPASVYHPDHPCKHRRKYYPGPAKEQVEASKPRKLARPPEDEYSLRPKGKWPGGYNGPWDEMETKKTGAKEKTVRSGFVVDGAR